MTCPACNSTNVTVQTVTNTQLEKQPRSAAWWLLVGWWWWLFFFWLALLVKIFAPKRQKIVNTHSTMCVCQNCGNSWTLHNDAEDKKTDTSGLPGAFIGPIIIFVILGIALSISTSSPRKENATVTATATPGRKIVVAVNTPVPATDAETKLEQYISKFGLGASCKTIIMEYMPGFEKFSRMEQIGFSAYTIYLTDGRTFYLVVDNDNNPAWLQTTEKDYDSRTTYYDVYAK